MEARNLRAARGTPCEPTNRSKTGNGGGAQVWERERQSLVRWLGGELVDSPALKKREMTSWNFQKKRQLFMWMFGDFQALFYVKIWNHPIETSINACFRFQVGVQGAKLNLYLWGCFVVS